MQESQKLIELFVQWRPDDIDLSLDRIKRLLTKIGHPERHLPPVIHIAGTNGKGSTLAFLKAILQADNKRVHSYTSPHLVSFHERISLNGQDIEESYLTTLLLEIHQKNAGGDITYFEVITATALCAYSQIEADYLLLEVGLGGRLDATNVISNPKICIITPVSIDHESYLGHTYTEIAREKIGIFKRNIPVVISQQHPEAGKIIEEKAVELNCPTHISGQDWHAKQERNRLSFYHTHGVMDLPSPNLQGIHQFENAGAAIMTAHILGISEKAIATGITQAIWPARLQKLARGALTKLSTSPHIWLDGGHNPEAANILSQWIEQQKNPLFTIICGMVETKNTKGWFNNFRPVSPIIHTITIPDIEKSIDAQELANIANEQGLTAQAFPSIQEALSAIQNPESCVLICGSLHLSGYVLRKNQ